jgi:cell division protein FtsX
MGETNMFRNYLTLGLRNIFKNKLHSLINIVGLAIAIGTCIWGYVNYEFSQSFDGFHKNGDRIFEICSVRKNSQALENWCLVPVPLTTAVTEDIPGVEKSIPLDIYRGTLKYEDKVFQERLVFAGADFFDVFSFPILKGDKDALSRPDQIVLSEDMASKYFGEDDPLGKQLIVSLNESERFPFQVGAVAKNFPKNTTLPCDILLPSERIRDIAKKDITDWGAKIDAAFIRISENVSPAGVSNQLQKYVDLTNGPQPNWQIDSYYLEPLTNVPYLTGNELRGYPFRGSLHPAAIIAPSIVALLILFLACFNYINIAISSSAQRLKEIGIRKVVGALRSQLVLQFLGENAIICTLALVLGVGLGEVFVSFYNGLWPELDLRISLLENPAFLLFVGLLLLVTAIIAGAYPAFYISSFRPVSILQGRQKLARTNPYIKILVTFQFVISMLNIIIAFAFSHNSDFLQNGEIGFKHKNILTVPLQNASQFDLLRQTLASRPEIIQIAGTRNAFLSWSDMVEARHGEAKSRAAYYHVGENYLELIEIDAIHGRTFDFQQATDLEQVIMVNETFIKEMGLPMAAGQYVKLTYADEEREYLIKAIFRDVNDEGIYEAVEPVVLKATKPNNYAALVLEFDSDKHEEVSVLVKNAWLHLFPYSPYEGYFYEDTMTQELRVSNTIKTSFLYISIIASLLVTMGLFALISLNIAKRTKEIAIRKIVGASVARISNLIVKDTAFLLLFAAIISIGAGYFLVDLFVASIYDHYAPFSLTPYLLASFIVMFVALFAFLLQIGKIVMNNPVESLRYE